jgi:PAS domain S-box-containing protein
MSERSDPTLGVEPVLPTSPGLPNFAQALLDNVREAVIAIDSDMRVIYWSRGAEALYGVTAESAFGARLDSLHQWLWLQPEDEANAYRTLDRVGSWRGENIHVLRSGERRHVESTVVRLLGGGDAPSGMLALIRDVTDRARERDALRASEERFRSVVDNSPDVIARFDRAGRHLFVSAEAERATGMQASDIVGKTNAELGMPAELVELWHSSIQSVFETGKPAQIQFPFRLGNEQHYYDGRLVPERGRDGAVASVLTVTRRVTAEVSLLESLRQSEERANLVAGELRALLDAVPAAVFIARDRESRRIDTNRFGLELLRRTNDGNVSLSAPEDEAPSGFRCFRDGVEIAASELPVQRAARTGTAIRDFDWDLVFDDGVVRNLLGNVEPLLDSNGSPRGAVSAVVDITDRKSAEKVAEETRKRLLGMISHELRTPLNAMSIAIGLLQSKLVGADERRLLDTIARNLKIQSRLVDDLLDTSRADRGKLVSQRVPLQLDEAVTAVMEMLGPEASGRNVTVGLALSAPDYVFGDRTRLEQVITNLVSNAIKFTPAHGRITIETRQRGRFAQLVVSDTGIGLAADQLERVFEQFQQGEVATSSKRGLGLGLAIAKAIVDEHEGRLWVESEGAGKGARFGVELPNVKSGGSRPPPSLSASARVGTIRVLLVEDNEDTRKLLAASLQSKDYVVASAASVDQALVLLDQELPDLALIDINLEGKSGLELVRRLQEGQRFRHLPTFAVTARDERDDIRDIREAGFSGHFVKPVDVNALDVAIREHLGPKAQ